MNREADAEEPRDEGRRARASVAGVTLAESDETKVVEGNHYFPPESVDWELMRSARMKTLCPWKGVASYYGVEVRGQKVRGAAWTYRHPFPWIRKIRDHVAFVPPVEIEG